MLVEAVTGKEVKEIQTGFMHFMELIPVNT